MKRLFFLAVFSVGWNFSLAQFGNEWIQHSQVYLKISVGKDSLYKLTYDDLQQAGFPVTTVDPRRIQLFHHGQEVAIYVEGESDARLDPGDFIEFYGCKNDGSLDAELYEPASLQPHPYFNLYSDTTSYFLTFNPLAVLGKRMGFFSEVNVSNIPAEAFHFSERLLVLSNQYSPGHTENTYFNKTAFDLGEGWTGTMIREGQFLDYQMVDLTNGAEAGGFPQLELMLVGRGPMQHNVEVSAGSSVSSLRVLATPNFTGFSTFQISELLNWTDIGSDGKLIVRIRTIGVGGAPDRVSASYIKVRYPRGFNTNLSANRNLILRQNSGDKSYIEISDPLPQARVYDITDPLNVVRIGTTSSASLNAVVAGTSVQRKLWITNTTATPVAKRVSFRFINPAQTDFVILSHRSLMRPAMGYGDVVRAYGAYRASPAGGSYDTLVIDIDQIYNQFNYGEISPLGIRNFMKFLVNTRIPKYFFIIGKGLDVGYNYYRNPTAASFANHKSLIPSAGYPASDAAFTAGLGGTTYEPLVPTGRITAMLPEHVGAYLNKVKEMEALPYDALWRKDVLHLSGGVHPGEPARFKSYLEGFQTTAENLHLGGQVKAIAKQSTEIEFINVADQINKGLNLVTFFGHSSAINIDFDIGYVTDPVLGYNNPGKYPMLLINGCNAGSYFINRTLFGEDWINAANKGAVGFLAHSSLGLEFTLHRYSDIFYSVGYGDSVFIKKGIGDIQKEINRRYIATSAPTVVHISQAQQMILLGDPAVRLFGAEKPDYEITENSLSIASFDDAPVTALSDSLALKIIVRNYGITNGDTLRVRLTRTYADNTSVTFDSVYYNLFYSDTLTFTVKRDQNSAAGNNSFKVELDPDNVISELNEENNVAFYNFIIPLNRTKNLFPYDNAIVNTTDVTLKFQTSDLLSDTRSFLLEVDTVNTFDSPFKSEFNVEGKVLASQPVTLLEQDSLAYYWRTRLADPLPGESEEWVQSSFSHIQDGPEGWAQIHFPQYLSNKTVGLVKDPELRLLTFEETVTSVYINNFGSATGTTNLDVSVKLNGAEYQLRSTNTTERVACRNNTINMIAFNRVTTFPYAAIPFIFQDTRTCGREPQVILNLQPAQVEVSMAEAVDNIQPGDSVVLFSIGNAGITSWSDPVKVKLGELGISVAQINALQAGEPVVIFGRKGLAPGTAKVYKTSETPANEQALVVDETITGRYTFGNMASPLIGPAQHWEKLTPTIETPEPNDVVNIDIVGVKLDLEEVLLVSGVTSTNTLTGIDAEEYPYLKLIYHTEDDLNLTATQLEKWVVEYTPMPEGLLFYNGSRSPVSMTEGETWIGEYGFVNISDKLFPDSLTVRFGTFNRAARTSSLLYRNIVSPEPDDTTYFSFSVLTEGKGGLNDIDVYVNPRIVPEQYYDNNVLMLMNYLDVLVDNFNPVLEVTIDGRFIIDRDFVSSDPEIRMRLWDDNRMIQKSDTTGISIFLKYPCESDECPYVPIYFNRPDVTWYPASHSSDFIVEFNPTGLSEGMYTLRVNMADSRGNTAGGEPYEITFAVNYESSAVLLAPYPNPSQQSFTFTLVISGANSPDHFGVEVVNVNGQSVRTMNLHKKLFVGTNEIEWDGRSDSGNDLPAGVYLYRIVLQREGKNEPIKVPISSTYFRGGYGKLVLVR